MSISWFHSIRDDRAARRLQERRRRFALEPLEGRQMLSTFTVTSDADSTARGTLRWAITESNKTTATEASPNQIDFDLPSADLNLGLYTVELGSALPALTQPVVIDGLTQPNADGQPVIEVSGELVESTAAGLQVNSGASGSTIEGLTVTDFLNGTSDGDGGILVDGASKVMISHDDIGLENSSVELADGENYYFGVALESGATDNTVTGDVLAGNQTIGVLIDGNGSTSPSSETSGNVVEGDYIGTNLNGSGAAESGNVTGVEIENGAMDNTIGGTAAADRDVISGNSNDGVLIEGPGTDGNVVEGDDIGTNAGGTAPIGNGYAGVAIQDGASDNTIGGTASGAADVISGNATYGVLIYGTDYTTLSTETAHNVVEGDFIGTNDNGSSGGGSLANTDGVDIASGATDNTVGGAAAADRDVISGNSYAGVLISDPATEGNVVEGDDIGTNAGGSTPIGNGYAGVVIQSDASDNTIGGTAARASDVISANGTYGVLISDSDDNVVEGDFIGTNDNGSSDTSSTGAMLGNADGVDVENGAANNTIGGTTTAARDVLSGNSLDGAQLSDSGPGNVIEGDDIGTNAGATAGIPNGRAGVTIQGGSTKNTVGGTAAGSADVISGNGTYGVWIVNGGTSGNLIEGDFIGTDDNGSKGGGSLANGYGVVINAGASSNTIGGTTTAARDVISGNTFTGVVISDSGTEFNWVEGDHIGTNAAGSATVPNGADGVVIQNGATLDDIETDVISGNVMDGVLITGSGTDFNTVQSALIGINAADNAVLDLSGKTYSNSDGVQIDDGAEWNAIQENVISGNGYGVEIDGPSTGNCVDYNDIGTNAAGTLDLGNNDSGIYMNDADGDYIYGNTVDNNGGYGILFQSCSTSQDEGTNTFSKNALGDES